MSLLVLLLWFIDRSGLTDEMLRVAHLFFYVADEGGNALSLGRGVTGTRENSVLAAGTQADVGGWQLHLKSMVCCQALTNNLIVKMQKIFCFDFILNVD